MAWTVLAAQALWDLLSAAPRALAHAHGSAGDLGAQGRRSSRPASFGDAARYDAQPLASAGHALPTATHDVPSAARPAAAGKAPLHSASANVSPVPSAPSLSQLEEKLEHASPSMEPENVAYHGAPCSGVFVYIVTVAEHAPDSAASIAIEPNAPARFMHPGQSVGDWDVLAIADDWSGTSPVVWLRHEGEVCSARLGSNPQRSRASQDASPRRPMPQRFFRR